ncbi:hypothetical protein PARMER_03247 [Parabacteroides merdae ATCC 43184]|nr:hypothetical protein PARMER_03247 [Parabacteroides merdae ATCC 43184]
MYDKALFFSLVYFIRFLNFSAVALQNGVSFITTHFLLFYG